MRKWQYIIIAAGAVFALFILNEKSKAATYPGECTYVVCREVERVRTSSPTSEWAWVQADIENMIASKASYTVRLNIGESFYSYECSRYYYDKATSRWWDNTGFDMGYNGVEGRVIGEPDEWLDIPVSTYNINRQMPNGCEELPKPCETERAAKIQECGGESEVNWETWDDTICTGECVVEKLANLGSPDQCPTY